MSSAESTHVEPMAGTLPQRPARILTLGLDLASKLWAGWSRFWFECDSREQMRVFRSGLGALLLAFYAIRTMDLGLFFSDAGITPAGVVGEIMDSRYRLSLLTVFPGQGALWAFNTAFLASLLCLALGVGGRIAAAVAFVLHVSFIHRSPSIAFGVDLISTFYLLYFCFADFRKQAPREWDLRATVGSVFFRFAQIQLCIIYGYSGLHKLKSPLWWKGEAVWHILANQQLARWDNSWIASFPLLVVALTYSTMLWEIYFPALIWVRVLRPWMLAFGVMMHLGIAVSINIPFFGALMILSYALFLSPETIRSARNKFQVPRRVSDRSYV